MVWNVSVDNVLPNYFECSKINCPKLKNSFERSLVSPQWDLYKFEWWWCWRSNYNNMVSFLMTLILSASESNHIQVKFGNKRKIRCHAKVSSIWLKCTSGVLLFMVIVDKRQKDLSFWKVVLEKKEGHKLDGKENKWGDFKHGTWAKNTPECYSC